MTSNSKPIIPWLKPDINTYPKGNAFKIYQIMFVKINLFFYG